MCAQSLSHVQLLATPWAVDCQAASVHGIFQARILEWVDISSSRGFSQPRELNLCLLGLLHWQADSLPLSHLGSPYLPILKGKINYKLSIQLHYYFPWLPVSLSYIVLQWLPWIYIVLEVISYYNEFLLPTQHRALQQHIADTRFIQCNFLQENKASVFNYMRILPITKLTNK